MFTLTQTIQKQIAIGVMAVALCFGMMMPAIAQAESQDYTASKNQELIMQLMEMVQQLMKQLIALQAQQGMTYDEDKNDNDAKDDEYWDDKKDEYDENAELSCEIDTDKNSYSFGEDIEVEWESEGATYGYFYDGNGAKDNLSFPRDKFDAEGETELEVDVYGNPTIYFKAVNEEGEYAKCATTFSVEDDEERDVAIENFDAKLDGRSNKYSPYLFFSWDTEGASTCSIFMNGNVLFSNVAPNGNKLLSRYTAVEDLGQDFKQNNKFELRCQSAYTLKDYTVSEEDEVEMDQQFVESYTADFEGFMNEEEFASISDVTKVYAYELCEEKAGDNPGAEISCLWGDRVIYMNFGKG